MPLAAQTVAVYAIIFAAFHLFEVLREPKGFSPIGRLLHVLSPLDLRTFEKRSVSFQSCLALKGLGFFASGVSLLFVGARIATPTAPWSSVDGLIRTLVASIGAYFIADGIDGLLRTGTALAGYSMPPIQVTPIRARTLAEFWGRRWNRVVGAWLRDNCFEPLARRGHPALGSFAAFSASAVLHVVPVFVVAGVAPAVWIGTFFLLHGGLVAIERLFRVGRWPAPAAHLFVVGSFVATAPFFIEPYLRAFGL